MSRLFFIFALLLLAGAPARAADVALRIVSGGCGVAPVIPPAGAAADAACRPADPAGRTWLVAADRAAFADLPERWNLLVGRNRFDSIQILIVHDRGVTRINRPSDALGVHGSFGNNLRFDIGVPGREVRAVAIGYEGIDTPSLVRSVRALSPEALARHETRWSVLAAAVMGVLLCALAYNLFLLTWLKTAFQRWYVLWLVSAGAYTLSWTGAINQVVPTLAGPAGARLDYILVGMIVATGAAFFYALVEDGKLPDRLKRVGRWSAAAVMITAVIAAADTIFSATLGDRLLNIAFVVGTLVAVAGIVIAIRRGSRAVWFYLAGWSLPLFVFMLRVARNFGLAPKSEAVDMASFAAIAFEAIALSLAIADRYRALARAADKAEAERATLLRLATTDPLTGLGNRAAFRERLARMEARAQPADLVLLDLDFLKEANDRAGHDAGDALLVEAARRLRAAVGPEPLVARLGGDEFAVLLKGEQRDRLPALLAVIEVATATPVIHGDHMLRLSFSAGHAAWTPGGEGTDRLFKNADIALYEAKTLGRNRYRSRPDKRPLAVAS